MRFATTKKQENRKQKVPHANGTLFKQIDVHKGEMTRRCNNVALSETHAFYLRYRKNGKFQKTAATTPHENNDNSPKGWQKFFANCNGAVSRQISQQNRRKQNKKSRFTTGLFY